MIAAYYIGGPLDMTKQMLRNSPESPPRQLFAYEPIKMPSLEEHDSTTVVSAKPVAYKLLCQCRNRRYPTFIYELEVE